MATGACAIARPLSQLILVGADYSDSEFDGILDQALGIHADQHRAE